MNFKLLFPLYFIVCTVWSQDESYLTVQGRVADASNGNPVPYASIGIVGKSLGTSSNVDGEFSFKILLRNGTVDEKIKISCVGYESLILSELNKWQEIRLVPSTLQLKEVLVLGKDLRPVKIVRKAFNRIHKNYNSRPFVYKTFYRHYCKDDSVYGRLIEAAVDIYKRKGHRTPFPAPGTKEEVRVTQLRRSFDSTKVSRGHQPISLYSVMSADPVSYQTNGTMQDIRGLIVNDISNLKRNLKNFDFELVGLTEFDGIEVFKINYESKGEGIAVGTSGFIWKSEQLGTLYISTKDYAFVKAERSRFSFDTLRTVTTYKKFNGKYYWHHTSTEGHSYNSKSKFRHTYHIDLMANEYQTKNIEKFTGRQPGRESLALIKYDPTFWDQFNILKATPLENKIINDLGGNKSLNKQFADHDSVARLNVLSRRSGEDSFNRFWKASKGHRILYVDFWASWCAPCIQEMIFEKRLLKKYEGKITFVLLSVDNTEEAWKKAIVKYKLALPGFHHYHIGPESDLSKFFDINSIPRYLLIKKNGDFYALDANRPSNPELEKDFDLLLEEN